MKPKVSIINCTARKGGIDILLHSLQRQTFQDFEVLIMDELQQERELYLMDYFKAKWPQGWRKVQHIKPLPKKEGMFWNLGQSLNQAIAMAQGEIVVFLQDYIYMEADGIEKFVKLHEEKGSCLITGVGPKCNTPDWAIDLDNLISIFIHDDESKSEPWKGVDKPGMPYELDPRQGDLRNSTPCIRPGMALEWEANYASANRHILEEIGGSDERFDAAWGYDNTNLAERAQFAKYEIWVDETNIHYGFNHDKLFGARDFKHNAPNNNLLWEEILNEIKKGRIKIPDLDNMKKRLEVKVMGRPSSRYL